ncbi:MAG: bifunctional glycosyltransferase family 2/GtrA family protein [Oscillospiraceae bacterium]|nr:bifunctional glycosyltransferase family 2/GtrA family protein [Oscillospiraceae bacterium]
MDYKIAILIPAFKPNDYLCHLIATLRDSSFLPTLVVDDGSGEEYNEIFEKAERLGAEVIHFPDNKGKGAALKCGFKYLSELGYSAAITADADGQHTADDILKIAKALTENPRSLILGIRDTDEMPTRYRAVNATTSRLFKLLYGINVPDTQTGLRGVPLKRIKRLLNLEGEHFEYEMNMLITYDRIFKEIIEVPIKTIFIDDNKASHFRPIYDNAKIFSILLKRLPKFLISSFSAFCIDYTIFALLIKWTGSMPVTSTIIARLISGSYNYTINKFFVFKKSKGYTAAKYFTLSFSLLAINCLLITFAVRILNIPPLIAKIFIEMTMYVINFTVQSRMAQIKK